MSNSERRSSMELDNLLSKNNITSNNPNYPRLKSFISTGNFSHFLNNNHAINTGNVNNTNSKVNKLSTGIKIITQSQDKIISVIFKEIDRIKNKYGENINIEYKKPNLISALNNEDKKLNLNENLDFNNFNSNSNSNTSSNSNSLSNSANKYNINVKLNNNISTENTINNKNNYFKLNSYNKENKNKKRNKKNNINNIKKLSKSFLINDNTNNISVINELNSSKNIPVISGDSQFYQKRLMFDFKISLDLMIIKLKIVYYIDHKSLFFNNLAVNNFSKDDRELVYNIIENIEI